ncbi:MAG: DUF4238 domain-containing protein [Clostridiaceae bacterium]|nr:DUF4238 domain-containing protein [Clostridiaceae bacterium]
MANTTKKQHYVWRKYLIPWTDNGNIDTGKVFVYRKETKGTQQTIEQRELMKIAFENYYYDISGFNPKDVSVYKQFIEHLQRNNIVKWGINLDDIGIANTQRDFIEKEVMCSIENIDNDYGFLDRLKAGDITFYKDSTVQESINTLNNVIFESILFQEQVLSDEDAAKIFMRAMQNINEPDLKYEFNLFLSMQYFRSPRIHTNLSDSFEEFKKLSEGFSDLSTSFYVNLITLFFAQTMALSITQNMNTSIILYENKSSIPFITGDTPIVNISDKEEIALFHYPISPTVAVNVVSSKTPLKNAVIEIDEDLKLIVGNLNRKLYKNCVNEVYSNNQGIFKRDTGTGSLPQNLVQ